MTLIDGFVVVGVAVVLPLALGGSWVQWSLAGAAVIASFSLGRGPSAGALAVVFVAVAIGHLGATAAGAGPLLFWRVDDIVAVLAALWAVVASGSLLVSRLGWTPLGQAEPIIELTAVHYLYAGAASLVLAGRTRRALPIVVTATAPLTVAAGFLTGWAIPQVGGAVLMAAGVWMTASLELRDALDRSRARAQRVLLAVSGLTIWVPMVLAVAWAAGQHVSIPILSIPDMARTHGAANALGFVVCGLVAARIPARSLADA